MDRILAIHFRPPLAIARVGGSDTPLEAFDWAIDRANYSAHRTVIRPSITFEVLPDGSIRPYVPNAIQFRDGDLLRPVAPFFELWATVESGVTGRSEEQPVTLELLHRVAASLSSMQYFITVANRKAECRTASPLCGYLAHASVDATDWNRRELLAYSPCNPNEEPLVSRDRPISLGFFQAIKPVAGSVVLDINRSVLRVRFTPARGLVYGPPWADVAPASSLQQGEELPPNNLAGKLHQIVSPQNRILNPDTPWSRYVMGDQNNVDPAPPDSYDGSNIGNRRSWGVVDDCCDGIIEAHLVVAGRRIIASARVLSTCPDFAPDRRPFFSFSDDIEDRDLLHESHEPVTSLSDEIADLFKRIFETAGTINLDATRHKFISENASRFPVRNFNGLPRLDDTSMTRDDVPYAKLTRAIFHESPTRVAGSSWLRYPDIARLAHSKLTDAAALKEFLTLYRGHVARIVRPPYGRFRQLKRKPRTRPSPHFRDPRVERDTIHDMRMPPFMRDSDNTPLSLTWRQYHRLMQLLELLDKGHISRPSMKSLGGKFRSAWQSILKRVLLHGSTNRDISR